MSSVNADYATPLYIEKVDPEQPRIGNVITDSIRHGIQHNRHL
jgi:hypothetical protein